MLTPAGLNKFLASFMHWNLCESPTTYNLMQDCNRYEESPSQLFITPLPPFLIAMAERSIQEQ